MEFPLVRLGVHGDLAPLHGAAELVCPGPGDLIGQPELTLERPRIDPSLNDQIGRLEPGPERLPRALEERPCGQRRLSSAGEALPDSPRGEPSGAGVFTARADKSVWPARAEEPVAARLLAPEVPIEILIVLARLRQALEIGKVQCERGADHPSPLVAPRRAPDMPSEWDIPLTPWREVPPRGRAFA